MKKALVHDWYYTRGGAEKVVHSINSLWGDFYHYGLIDFLNEEDREYILNGKRAKTSFIQKLPTSKSNHRKFLQFFPFAIEQFDLSKFDLIISSSSSIAKGVLTHHEQLHICYCHSPMRYAWDLYHQYLTDSGLTTGLKGVYAKYILNKIRLWDIISSNRVDFFIANSNFIAERIKKIYRRDSYVIYPPVDIEKFELKPQKEDFYFTASRMVPYKKIELIVRAFNAMPRKKLIVGGDGPDFSKIKKIANKNITFTGFLPNPKLKYYLQNAKAFVFAAKEDFGIIPIEAQACGTPVIGFQEGGLGETILNNKTGILFNRQQEKSIIDAVNYFETQTFDPFLIRENAERFSRERFEIEFKTFTEKKYDAFKKGKQSNSHGNLFLCS